MPNCSTMPRFARGGIIGKRYPWEQDPEEQGPPPYMDEAGPPIPGMDQGPPQQVQDAPPPMEDGPPMPPQVDLRESLPVEQGGPPPLRPASPADRFAPPPTPRVQQQAPPPPPQPLTDRFQQQVQMFQNRKDPGKVRQILGGVLAATKFRGAAPYVSGEAGRERDLEKLRVAQQGATEEQQVINHQQDRALKRAQGEAANEDRDLAREQRTQLSRPQQTPAQQIQLWQDAGYSREQAMQIVQSGGKLQPQAAPRPTIVPPNATVLGPDGKPSYTAPPAPKPSKGDDLRETVEAKTQLADQQGLKGSERQHFIYGTPMPPAPAAGGASDDPKVIAQGIIEGKQPPTLNGLYRNATPVRAELQRKGYDLMTAQRDWTAVQKHLSTLNGQQQERLRQAISFTSDSLENIGQLYEEWRKVAPTSGIRVLNRAALSASKQLGGKAGEVATNLEAQINDLTSELGTVYKGGNGSTDESLRLAGENLKADWNDQTFKRALAQIRQNLTIRRNSILSSAPVGVSDNSPYAPRQNAQADGGTIGYQVGADHYNIPADKEADFLKAHPNAVKK